MAKKEKEIKKETPEVEVKEEKVDAQIVEPTEPQPTTFEYSDDILKSIEDNRAKFYKRYRLSSIFKWIIAFFAIGLLVFAFLGIPNIVTGNDPLRISLMVSLGVVSLIIMATYTLVSKFVLNKKAKNYFADFYNNITSYVFSGEGYEEVSCDAAKKIERIEFDENLLYKGVDMVGSRATTEFKYKHLPMKVCDCAAQVRIDRRPRPVFVGKYIVAPSKYELDDPIFIYVKGDEKRALPPTNMDDYKMVFDDDKMSVYSNNGNWNKVVTSKIKNRLLQIKEGDSLVDFSISLKQNKMFVCLGYDDDLMVLPLERIFNPKPNEEYKVEVNKLVKLIEEMNK